jgi:hypothetical protein
LAAFFFKNNQPHLIIPYRFLGAFLIMANDTVCSVETTCSQHVVNTLINQPYFLWLIVAMYVGVLVFAFVCGVRAGIRDKKGSKKHSDDKPFDGNYDKYLYHNPLDVED